MTSKPPALKDNKARLEAFRVVSGGKYRKPPPLEQLPPMPWWQKPWIALPVVLGIIFVPWWAGIVSFVTHAASLIFNTGN